MYTSYMRNATGQNETIGELGEWITTTEAGKILELTRRRVVQLIEAQVLDAKKMTPRLWMVRRKSVEGYKERQR